MSTLLLVRHGQASFGSDDYDVLSALGEEQARLLGAHFAATGQRLDALYVGPRKRQRDSARLLREAARAGGLDVPEPVEIADLDEYAAELLIRQNFTQLVADDPALATALDPATPPAERAASFDRLFDVAMLRWLEDRLDTTGLESFAEFMTRVRRALGAVVRAEGRGKQVLVVSSAGTISAAVGQVLGVEAEVALRLGYVMANTSVSVLKYRGVDALSLVSFNATPHLSAASLVTWR